MGFAAHSSENRQEISFDWHHATPEDEDGVPLTLEAGTIIGGNYRLDQLIAIGGMGEVHKATHLRLGRNVAVKVMLPHLIEYAENITRFLNEALGIASVHHRNIVDMLDVGTTEDGRPFFVMEYLSGETLRARLGKKRVIPCAEAFEIMTQTLSGLSVLHARGIIHRDLKPSNIFISEEEDGTEIVKILDFGISKFHIVGEKSVTDLTTTQTILGTPGYMSPEQARGKKGSVDARADIYSCGMVLYRCLTGVNPLTGETYNDTIVNILTASVPPPSFVRSTIPAAVDDIVMKAIERDREKRFQDCKSFMEALRLCDKHGKDEKSSQAAPPSYGAATDAEEESHTGGGFSQLSSDEKTFMASRRLVLGVVLAAIGAAALGAPVWFLRNRIFGAHSSGTNVFSNPSRATMDRIRRRMPAVMAHEKDIKGSDMQVPGANQESVLEATQKKPAKASNKKEKEKDIFIEYP